VGISSKFSTKEKTMLSVFGKEACSWRLEGGATVVPSTCTGVRAVHDAHTDHTDDYIRENENTEY